MLGSVNNVVRGFLEGEVKRYGSAWLAVALLMAGLIWLLHRLAPVVAVDALVRDWWPVGMVAVGLAGAARPRTPLGVSRGPVIFAVAGAVILAILHNPVPQPWRPALLPLVLCGAGVAILVVRLARAPARELRPFERILLIGQGRRVTWPVRTPTVLAIHAIASGSIVTIPDSATAKAGRLEITALLSDVEVIVPDGWTVWGPSTSARRSGRSPDLDPVVAVRGGIADAGRTDSSPQQLKLPVHAPFLVRVRRNLDPHLLQ